MIDIIARGMIEESNGDISQLSETVTTHTENDDIHVTMRDKENWNSHPTDITASGNPISLDGLQGGVPFADITVSGKNLLQKMSSKTIGGLTYLTNDDGTISVTGTQTAENYSNITSVGGMLLKSGDYTLSGGTERLQITALDVEANAVIARSKLDPATFSIDTDKYVRIYVYSAGAYNGQTFDDVLYPQLEIGSVATAYEQPITGRELTLNANGIDYTITPDSNPYTITDDIRQYDGLNNISVSAGELSVTGIRKNAAIKSIWDNMGMDLLFDGVTDESNPAVFDLTGYKTIEINHIIISNEKAYPVVIRMSIDNYLATPSTIISPIHASSISTAHNENGNISSLYAVSAAGAVMTNTKIFGIK